MVAERSRFHCWSILGGTPTAIFRRPHARQDSRRSRSRDFTSLAADGTASGTVVYKGKTVAIKHVWLVKGPDSIDPKLTIRELIFSAADIGAKVKACKKMTCLGSYLDDGLTVKLDVGPRLNYWMVLDGQRIQYSGTAKPETLNATANTAERIAGKLTIDDTKAGGGKIEIDFDTPLTAELNAGR